MMQMMEKMQKMQKKRAESSSSSSSTKDKMPTIYIEDADWKLPGFRNDMFNITSACHKCHREFDNPNGMQLVGHVVLPRPVAGMALVGKRLYVLTLSEDLVRVFSSDRPFRYKGVFRIVDMVDPIDLCGDDVTESLYVTSTGRLFKATVAELNPRQGRIWEKVQVRKKLKIKFNLELDKLTMPEAETTWVTIEGEVGKLSMSTNADMPRLFTWQFHMMKRHLLVFDCLTLALIHKLQLPDCVNIAYHILSVDKENLLISYQTEKEGFFGGNLIAVMEMPPRISSVDSAASSRTGLRYQIGDPQASVDRVLGLLSSSDIIKISGHSSGSKVFENKAVYISNSFHKIRANINNANSNINVTTKLSKKEWDLEDSLLKARSSEYLLPLCFASVDTIKVASDTTIKSAPPSPRPISCRIDRPTHPTTPNSVDSDPGSRTQIFLRSLKLKYSESSNKITDKASNPNEAIAVSTIRSNTSQLSSLSPLNQSVRKSNKKDGGYPDPLKTAAPRNTASATGHLDSVHTLGHQDSAKSLGHAESAKTPANHEPAKTSGHTDPARVAAHQELTRTTGLYEPAKTTGQQEPAKTSGQQEPTRTTRKQEPAKTTGQQEPAKTSGHNEFSRTTRKQEPAKTMGQQEPAKTSGHNEPTRTTRLQEPAKHASQQEEGGAEIAVNTARKTARKTGSALALDTAPTPAADLDALASGRDLGDQKTGLADAVSNEGGLKMGGEGLDVRASSATLMRPVQHSTTAIPTQNTAIDAPTPSPSSTDSAPSATPSSDRSLSTCYHPEANPIGFLRMEKGDCPIADYTDYGESKGSSVGVQMVRMFDGQKDGFNFLNYPGHLALDEEENVFVADVYNDRILLLKHDLNQYRVLLERNIFQMRRPTRVLYQNSKKRLVVGHAHELTEHMLEPSKMYLKPAIDPLPPLYEYRVSFYQFGDDRLDFKTRGSGIEPKNEQFVESMLAGQLGSISKLWL